MPANPPENMPRISPYIFCRDVGANVDWLVKTCGFTERLRMPGPGGTILHAEVELADGVVMLGNPGPDYRNPKQIGSATQLIYVYVDDVDEHFERARAMGARILSEPEDQFYGDRRYAVEDPEGHQWNFAQHVREVPPEEMKLPG